MVIKLLLILETSSTSKKFNIVNSISANLNIMIKASEKAPKILSNDRALALSDPCIIFGDPSSSLFKYISPPHKNGDKKPIKANQANTIKKEGFIPPILDQLSIIQ